MASRIRIELSVPAEVRQDGDYFVSFCPPFDVYSQGPDEEAALANLVEELQLFIESCSSRGVYWGDCNARCCCAHPGE